MRRMMVVLMIVASVLVGTSISASASDPCLFGCISMNSLVGPAPVK